MDSLHVPAALVHSFADDLLAALQSDDFTPTADIPGVEPRPSFFGEAEAQAEEDYADWCAWREQCSRDEFDRWVAHLEQHCTDPDPWGESCYFGAWGGHGLD